MSEILIAVIGFVVGFVARSMIQQALDMRKRAREITDRFERLMDERGKEQ